MKRNIFSKCGFNHTVRCGFLVFSVLLSKPLTAGFLDMPTIEEAPDFERKSMITDMHIPAVQDREIDPDAGPHLNIRKFKIQGLIDFSELGIYKEKIEEQIEAIRAEAMGEHELLDSGYTRGEIEAMSDLLGEIEENTLDRDVTTLELQDLVWLIREQRSKRGLTLGQIEIIADRISQLYRDNGFALAQAYIPEQDVRDGIVTLTVLVGSLGEVTAINNEMYDTGYLASAFDDQIRRPMTTPAIEEILYLVNDFPGLAATGFFEPGTQVGETRLKLDIKDERRYQANVRFDNHGSIQTGEYRLYGDVAVNNPLGFADQLFLAALMTAKPTNTFFGQLRYTTHVNPRTSIYAGFVSNDYLIGPGNSADVGKLKLDGITKTTEIGGNYRMKRSRVESRYIEAGYQSIESLLRVGALNDQGEFGLDDKVQNLSAAYSMDLLDEEHKILHQGTARATVGKFDFGAEPGQDDQYYIVNLDYSVLTFQQVPYIDREAKLVGRASFQYASSALSSINQFSLSGPSRARGFAINQFSADNALYLGADLVFESTEWLDGTLAGVNLDDLLDPYLFADVAYGQALAISGGDSVTAQLYDIGAGVQFDYKQRLRGSVQLAIPLISQFSSPDVQASNDSFRLLFDVQYSF